MSRFRRLQGYLQLEGEIECLTGLHIGSEKGSAEIGGIDQPVVRHPITREPYLPGSSLKGKLRAMREKVLGLPSNRAAGRSGRSEGAEVWRHECDQYQEARTCGLCRVFGTAGKGGLNLPGSLIVRDGGLTEESLKFLRKDGILATEAKSENSLDRLTAAASPRQIERVPAGASFAVSLVLRAETHGLSTATPPGGAPGQAAEAAAFDADAFRADLLGLLEALGHVEMEGLGGHASRGYGRVRFRFRRAGVVGPDGGSREVFAEPAGVGALELAGKDFLAVDAFRGLWTPPSAA